MSYECTPEYWDNVSGTHCESRPGIGTRYAQAQQLHALLKGLKYTAGTTILKTDLWTEGKDRHRRVWVSGTDAIGMDISRRTCLAAGVPAVQADIRYLPFKDNSLDLIWDMSTIDHIPPKDTWRAICEYHAALKPGGILVLAFTHAGSVRRQTEADCFKLNLSEMKRLVRAFFLPLEEYAIYFCNIGMAFTLTIPFLPAVQRFEYSPFSRRLAFLAYQYVIVARKP